MFQAILFLFLMTVSPITSLQATWTPSDPDGPLPLSKNYRQQLQRLCTLLKTNQPLPKDIENEREVIAKLCVKLRESENTIDDDSFSSSASPYLIYIIMGGIVLYFVYTNKDKFLKSTKSNTLSSTSIPSSSRSSTSSMPSSSSVKESTQAREARLKKFDRID